MIEFKAECGHTIRAKDGDEGKVVRCSYCGRTSQVPDKVDGQFESLFSDVADLEAGESVSAGTTIPRQRLPRAAAGKGPSGSRAASTGEGFNPFGLVLKMAYAAGVLVVLIVFAKATHNYVTRDSGRKPSRPQSPAVQPVARPLASGAQPPASSAKEGLIAVELPKAKEGIYVDSVPKGAMVRHRQVGPKGLSDAEEVFLDPDATATETDSMVTLAAGEYELVVALPINDNQLVNYPGYEPLRTMIELGGSTTALETFFLPDESVEISAFRLPNRQWVVARLYHARVFRKQWTLLTALFLPNRPISELMDYLPQKISYNFDEHHVLSELSHYEVPEPDRKYVADALHKLGMVSYGAGDPPSYRFFMIDPSSAVLTSWTPGER